MDPTNVPHDEAERQRRESAQQEQHSDPTGILARLAAIDALVRRIGPERISSANAHSTPSLHPVDDEDGHAIAAELGMVFEHDLASAVSYSGEVDGSRVVVFASRRPPFEHVMFLDSNPTREPGGASFERYPTREAAAEAARGAYGQVRWEPSGADEFTFTDRNGRRGYVVVRPCVAVA